MDTPLEAQYQQCTEVLSEEELRRLADQYGVADQRERKVPLRIFFWLMVLSASRMKYALSRQPISEAVPVRNI